MYEGGEPGKAREAPAEVCYDFEQQFGNIIQSLPSISMADRRPDLDDRSRVKRQKTDKAGTDPRNNPYLAHLYPDQNGDASKTNPFSQFSRHKTTAAMAIEVEDGEANPFAGKPFSSTYCSILKTRRDLPVHAQRYC
jgi:pre-mRNA-splicing factor ATP-dependent RNA helicase DHX15/PRP43